MVFYETTYILHSALQEGRLNDIISVIEKKAESLGAKILFSDNWGRKKLSYLIEKEKYGTYIFFQYKVEDVSKLSELSSEFEHNPNILRYLNIKIEEEDIMDIKTRKIETTKSKDVKTSKKVEKTVAVKDILEVKEDSTDVKEENTDVKEKETDVEEPADVEEETDVEEPADIEEETDIEEPADIEEETDVEEKDVSKEDDENKIKGSK